MRTVAQKYIDEGEAKGIQIGEVKLIKMLMSKGISVNEIAKMTGLSISKINELLKMNIQGASPAE